MLIYMKKVAAGFISVLLVFCLSLAPVYAGETPAADTEKTAVKYTTDRVHLRSGPSTEKDILETLDRGAAVNFIAIYNYEWSAVTYNNRKGFINSAFLSDEKPPEPTVELMNWSDVKPILKTGVAIPVYDIGTGLTYYVKSFSNGMHADVEPATKDDTAIMKRTYNNHWSWDGRPVWVTIGGHVIAAAINGMPHGGGVIDDDGMNGQICLHFKGSTVHNGNMVYSRQLQDVVMQAYNASF